MYVILAQEFTDTFCHPTKLKPVKYNTNETH